MHHKKLRKATKVIIIDWLTHDHWGNTNMNEPLKEGEKVERHKI